MPLFLKGLKGDDSSLAHPSCLDMKLHLRVEFRDIKSYSNTHLSFCVEPEGGVAESINDTNNRLKG